MNEVEIKFEPDNLGGVVPTGTYLLDAAKRLGVRLKGDCRNEEKIHVCQMTVTSGRSLLSDPTAAELEYLSAEDIIKGERLGCHAKLERSGEITITVKKQEEEKPVEEVRKEDLRKEFEELPLEKKIARLVELEAIALGETFSFVLNSPFKIFEKGMEILAELGLRMDDNARKAKRPEEHSAKAEADTNHENGSGPAADEPSPEAAAE
jgi:ferredoxin